ncbi:E3 ubiquitin-protein ligase BIG BROTHER-like [Salvia hispanica]|uniref:E3 ubiquitin-protein ligase BIG BROTHER-like n=1 Tax=Salvia hispanica TaxID=49212 RepID=UPI0020095E58|nr:E3 ubiquitin-protein ligase BIG BROTHER-like [Salvia hispanica]
MFWTYEQRVRFRVSSQPLQPIDFPHLSIKINVVFHNQEFNYAINTDSRPSETFLRPLPLLSSDSTTTVAAHVISRGHLSYADVQEEVGKLIRNHLRGDKRSQAAFPNGMGGDEFVCTPVIKLLWDQVLKATGISSEGVVNRTDTFIRMCLATSGFRRMKLCGDVAATEAAYPCTICSEEMTGTMAFRMPCAHLFHAECMVKWLWMRHTCPICRYEMPTGNPY